MHWAEWNTEIRFHQKTQHTAINIWPDVCLGFLRCLKPAVHSCSPRSWCYHQHAWMWATDSCLLTRLQPHTQETVNNSISQWSLPWRAMLKGCSPLPYIWNHVTMRRIHTKWRKSFIRIMRGFTCRCLTIFRWSWGFWLDDHFAAIVEKWKMSSVRSITSSRNYTWMTTASSSYKTCGTGFMWKPNGL